MKRVVNFVRPRPRYIPLTIEQLLESPTCNGVIDQFNHVFYTTGVANNLHWKGVPILKNPCDLWVNLEILYKLKPSVIIETGTHMGGSALFYTEMCRLYGFSPTYITIDIQQKATYDTKAQEIIPIQGYSTDPKIAEQVRQIVKEKAPAGSHVMVMLDSDHSEANVTNEIELYKDLVTVGSYLLVEDTNVNGHPSMLRHGPGPWESVEKLLAKDDRFEVDTACQKFMLTFNPRGWLKRVK